MSAPFVRCHARTGCKASARGAPACPSADPRSGNHPQPPRCPRPGDTRRLERLAPCVVHHGAYTSARRTSEPRPRRSAPLCDSSSARPPRRNESGDRHHRPGPVKLDEPVVSGKRNSPPGARRCGGMAAMRVSRAVTITSVLIFVVAACGGNSNDSAPPATAAAAPAPQGYPGYPPPGYPAAPPAQPGYPAPAPAPTYGAAPAPYPQAAPQGYPPAPQPAPGYPQPAPPQPGPGYPPQPAPAPAPAPAPTPPPAASAAAPMSTPGLLALPCQSDAICGMHHCNTQYGKCAFPCQTPADCINNGQCVMGVCLPGGG